MKVLCLILTLALAEAMIQCPKDVCKSMTCDTQLTAEGCANNGGAYKPSGGVCGCCDICVQQLNEGDDCTVSLLLGAVQTAECGKNLYCDVKTRTCRKPTCAMKKKEQDEITAKLPNRPLGMPTLKCDSDGSYAGKQCSGSKCYCVDKEGRSLGYMHDIWKTEDAITCQCARDKEEYLASNLIGRLFHCSDFGDYNNVQCHGSVCYCADRSTGKQLSAQKAVHISAKDTLKC